MVTFLEGEAGVFCVAALLGRLQKKEEVMYVTATFNSPRTSPHRTHSAANLAKLKAVHDIAMGTLSNELLYGKAGACPDMALRCSCSCCVCVCAAAMLVVDFRFRLSLLPSVRTEAHQARRCRVSRFGNENRSADYQGGQGEKVRFLIGRFMISIYRILAWLVF